MMYPAPGFGQVTQTSDPKRAQQEKLNELAQQYGIDVGESPYTENQAVELQEDRGDISGAGIAPPPSNIASNDIGGIEFAQGNGTQEHNQGQLAELGARPNFAQAAATGGQTGNTQGNDLQPNIGVTNEEAGVESPLNVQPSNVVTDQDVEAQQRRTLLADRFKRVSTRFNREGGFTGGSF